MEAAMFHLEQAAVCGVPQALTTMAEIYLQLPHELLSSASVQVSSLVQHSVGSNVLRGQREI